MPKSVHYSRPPRNYKKHALKDLSDSGDTMVLEFHRD